MKRAENIEKFKADANRRQKSRQCKRKAEDSEGFKEKANESKKKHEDMKKAKDMKSFKENMRQRKMKSENIRTAEQRLKRFLNRVRYGPIFVCSCCHQKLYNYQVDEYTVSLKEEIDLIDENIRGE